MKTKPCKRYICLSSLVGLREGLEHNEVNQEFSLKLRKLLFPKAYTETGLKHLKSLK